MQACCATYCASPSHVECERLTVLVVGAGDPDGLGTTPHPHHSANNPKPKVDLEVHFSVKKLSNQACTGRPDLKCYLAIDAYPGWEPKEKSGARRNVAGAESIIS